MFQDRLLLLLQMQFNVQNFILMHEALFFQSSQKKQRQSKMGDSLLEVMDEALEMKEKVTESRLKRLEL